MNKTTEQFYTDWKANLDNYLKGYAYGKNGQKKKTRFAFLMLEKYFHKFIDGSLPEEEKIVVLPGIRGAGKTTLLSQLYFFEDFIPENHCLVKEKSKTVYYKFYITADRLISEGIGLNEMLDFLEKNIFGDLASNNKKILLLIDEIQYDSKWSLFLKLLFDKTKGNSNILIFATGSSAIFLNQKNQDLVRRTSTERVLPEKFNEYLFLHQNIFPEKGLSGDLKNSIFYSENSEDVFEKIKKLRPKIVKKLSSLSGLNALKNDYFMRGTFPFSAQIDTQPVAMERIKNMVLINIVQKDLILSGDFDAETLVKIPDLLFLLANSDEVSTGTLSSILKLSPNTVNKILDSLVKTEILFELKPYGQVYSQIRKSSKFLFISPNIRAGLLSGFLNAGIKGKLLEDYMALIFEKEFKGKGSVLFDYAKGGADFIFRFTDKSEIVFELGFGKENGKQVKNTIKKTDNRAKYGIVIGSKELELDDNIVKIPLDYFLLI